MMNLIVVGTLEMLRALVKTQVVWSAIELHEASAVKQWHYINICIFDGGIETFSNIEVLNPLSMRQSVSLSWTLELRGGKNAI